MKNYLNDLKQLRHEINYALDQLIFPGEWDFENIASKIWDKHTGQVDLNSIKNEVVQIIGERLEEQKDYWNTMTHEELTQLERLYRQLGEYHERHAKELREFGKMRKASRN